MSTLAGRSALATTEWSGSNLCLHATDCSDACECSTVLSVPIGTLKRGPRSGARWAFHSQQNRSCVCERAYLVLERTDLVLGEEPPDRWLISPP